MFGSKLPFKKPINQERVAEIFKEGVAHSEAEHGGGEAIDFDCPTCQRITRELLEAFDMTAEESIPHLRAMGSKFVGLVENASGRRSAWDQW